MLPLSSEIMDHVTRDDDQLPAASMRNITPRKSDFVLPTANETPVIADEQEAFTQSEQ
jgi:hypothetical protein